MIITQENGIEVLLGIISDKLIVDINNWSAASIEQIESSQRTVRGGKVSTKETQDETVVLFSRDIRASREDVRNEQADNQNDDVIINALQSVLDIVVGQDDSNIVCDLNYNSADAAAKPWTITNVYLSHSGLSYTSPDLVEYLTGPNGLLNVSQFVGIGNQKSNINVQSANELLDSTVFELLPTQETRQARIDRFFEEYAILKGERPEFSDYDGDGSIETQDGYINTHDISYTQDNPDLSTIAEPDSYITRLNVDANNKNLDKTLEFLRDDLNSYLEDIDQELDAEIQDERPEYESKSEGYLKIRNLNQGIIVRKQEGYGVGLENLVTVSGGTYGPAGEDFPHPHAGYTGPSYLMDGFTITMWVKFLDKTARGTLFNYGNPLRGIDPRGFMLETYVLEKDGYTMGGNSETTWGSVATGTNLFQNSDSERFIRLVVYDHLPASGNGKKLYDSRMGIPGLPRTDKSVADFEMTGTTDYGVGAEINLLGHTRVPVDFNEWYFVVANYNPLIYDMLSAGNSEIPAYWTGNKHPDTGTHQHYSGYGNKCKVEIISRSDLLRARGYKV